MTWVLFFDGDCAMCSASARRLAAADHKEQLNFAPLQGELAQELGFDAHAGPDGTIVLWRESDGRMFLRSDAVAQLGVVLGGGWWCLRLLRLAPLRLRDWGYRWIAARRMRFGHGKSTCEVPDMELKRRLRD